jgi:hypothetical protein
MGCLANSPCGNRGCLVASLFGHCKVYLPQSTKTGTSSKARYESSGLLFFLRPLRSANPCVSRSYSDPKPYQTVKLCLFILHRVKLCVLKCGLGSENKKARQIAWLSYTAPKSWGRGKTLWLWCRFFDPKPHKLHQP